MRELYTQQLMTMKTRLIQMGAMCEDAISCSVKAATRIPRLRPRSFPRSCLWGLRC